MEMMKAQYPLAAMAEALEVSKSGFFAHRHKPQQARRQQDRVLLERIQPLDLSSKKRTGLLVSFCG
jgi:putative transposase